MKPAVRQLLTGRRPLSLASVYGRDSLSLTVSKYYKTTLTTADLTSPSGLANHASGGICASVAGVNGTATIPLPTAIDPNKPFRLHFYFELNGDVTNNLFLQVCSAAAPFWSGVRASVIKANNISANAGNATFFNAIAGLSAVPAGTKMWLSICGDGTYITASLIPDIASASFAASWNVTSPGFQANYNQINSGRQIYSDVSSGAGQFTWGRVGQSDQLTKLNIQCSSTSTRLIGVYCNVGSLEGPGDTVMGVPLYMHVSNSQDNDGSASQAPSVLIPPTWPANGKGFVFQHHPNGNAGLISQSNSGPAALAMYFAGYAQGTATGCQATGDIAGATSSNWGAPTGLQYRKNFMDAVRNYFNYYGKLHHFGMSMGALNALRYVNEYGDGSSVIGISGAVDLSDSFTNRGFSSIINNAFGAWYKSTSASNTGNTPELSSSFWTRINRDQAATGLTSLLSPNTWRDAYAAGTTYAQNDVVFRAYAGGVAGLGQFDPCKTPGQLRRIPIKLWHGDSDLTIPATQASTLKTAVESTGGTVTVVTVVGGTHLGATMYDTAAIVAFLDAN